MFPFCNVAGNLSVNDCSVWVSRSRWNKAIGRANSARNLEAALPKELGSACTGLLSPPAHVCPHHPGAGWLCWTVNSVEAGAQSLVQDLGCLLRKVYPVFNVEKGGMQLFSNEKLGCCICPLGDCSYKPVISITRNGRRAVRLACSACRRLWPSLHPLCPLPALPVYIY